jgi:hypothetical protein
VIPTRRIRWFPALVSAVVAFAFLFSISTASQVLAPCVELWVVSPKKVPGAEAKSFLGVDFYLLYQLPLYPSDVIAVSVLTFPNPSEISDFALLLITFSDRADRLIRYTYSVIKPGQAIALTINGSLVTNPFIRLQYDDASLKSWPPTSRVSAERYRALLDEWCGSANSKP